MASTDIRLSAENPYSLTHIPKGEEMMTDPSAAVQKEKCSCSHTGEAEIRACAKSCCRSIAHELLKKQGWVAGGGKAQGQHLQGDASDALDKAQSLSNQDQSGGDSNEDTDSSEKLERDRAREQKLASLHEKELQHIAQYGGAHRKGGVDASCTTVFYDDDTPDMPPLPTQINIMDTVCTDTIPLPPDPSRNDGKKAATNSPSKDDSSHHISFALTRKNPNPLPGQSVFTEEEESIRRFNSFRRKKIIQKKRPPSPLFVPKAAAEGLNVAEDEENKAKAEEEEAEEELYPSMPQVTEDGKPKPRFNKMTFVQSAENLGGSKASEEKSAKPTSPTASKIDLLKFIPVTRLDGESVLDWPAEMVQTTKLAPMPLAFSINPLKFDYGLLSGKPKTRPAPTATVISDGKKKEKKKKRSKKHKHKSKTRKNSVVKEEEEKPEENTKTSKSKSSKKKKRSKSKKKKAKKVESESESEDEKKPEESSTPATTAAASTTPSAAKPEKTKSSSSKKSKKKPKKGSRRSRKSSKKPVKTEEVESEEEVVVKETVETKPKVGTPKKAKVKAVKGGKPVKAKIEKVEKVEKPSGGESDEEGAKEAVVAKPAKTKQARKRTNSAAHQSSAGEGAPAATESKPATVKKKKMKPKAKAGAAKSAAKGAKTAVKRVGSEASAAGAAVQKRPKVEPAAAREDSGRISDLEGARGKGHGKWETSSDSELENIVKKETKTVKKLVKTKKTPSAAAAAKNGPTAAKAATKTASSKGGDTSGRSRRDSEMSQGKRSSRRSRHSSSSRDRSRSYSDDDDSYYSYSSRSRSDSRDSRYYSSDYSDYSDDYSSRSRSRSRSYRSRSRGRHRSESYSSSSRSRSRSYSRGRRSRSYSRGRRRSYSRSSRSYSRSRSRHRSRSRRREFPSSPDPRFSNLKRHQNIRLQRALKRKNFKPGPVHHPIGINGAKIEPLMDKVIPKPGEKIPSLMDEPALPPSSVSPMPLASVKINLLDGDRPRQQMTEEEQRKRDKLIQDIAARMEKDAVAAEKAIKDHVPSLTQPETIPIPGPHQSDNIPLPEATGTASRQNSTGSGKKSFIGPVQPGTSNIPLPSTEKFQYIGPNDPLVFKASKSGDGAAEGDKKKEDNSFMIPPEQALKYKALQDKARKHVARQNGEVVESSDEEEAQSDEPSATELAEQNAELDQLVAADAGVSPVIDEASMLLQPQLFTTANGQVIALQPQAGAPVMVSSAQAQAAMLHQAQQAQAIQQAQLLQAAQVQAAQAAQAQLAAQMQQQALQQQLLLQSAGGQLVQTPHGLMRAVPQTQMVSHAQLQQLQLQRALAAQQQAGTMLMGQPRPVLVRIPRPI